MPANTEQLDRVLAAFETFQKLGKRRARTEKERLEHAEELARAIREKAKRRE